MTDNLRSLLAEVMYTVPDSENLDCKRSFTQRCSSSRRQSRKLFIYMETIAELRMARDLQRWRYPAKDGASLKTGRVQVNNLLTNLYVKFQDLASREEGQDLVEYALVVALIAFGATAGMSSLSGAINTAFGNISSTLGTSIT